jgi:hypothetical protein
MVPVDRVFRPGEQMTDLMWRRGVDMYLLRACIPAAMAMLLAGCAGQRAASAACEPVAGDFGIAAIVYRECAVDQAAVPPDPMPRLQFTPTAAGCRRATIEIVVDTEGQPLRETAKVVRSDDPSFTEVVLASLHQVRYKPATKNGVAVYQLVRHDRTYQVVAVAVPAGSRPPSRPPRQSIPRC